MGPAGEIRDGQSLPDASVRRAAQLPGLHPAHHPAPPGLQRHARLHVPAPLPDHRRLAATRGRRRT